MEPPQREQSEATRALGALAAGDPGAAEKLLPLVYEQLRAIAGAYFRGQPADHTLQPTALVHEAFLRLIDPADGGGARDRAHFMALAATAMRQILIDHARRVRAAKRGGGRDRCDIDLALERRDGAAKPTASAERVDLLELDEALAELERADPRRYRVVELRYFGGLSIDQVAGMLGVSRRTVESDWRAARAWLGSRLGSAP